MPTAPPSTNTVPATPMPPSMPTPQQFQQPDPLAELREIHMPGEVSNWPPAPGWWMVGFLALILVAGLLTALIQRYKKRAYLRHSLKVLKQLELDFAQQNNSLLLTDQLATLLRRVCLSQFPREDVAGLSGERWLQFLNKTGNTNEFTQGCGVVLTEGRFQKGAAATINGEELLTLIRRWIKAQ